MKRNSHFVYAALVCTLVALLLLLLGADASGSAPPEQLRLALTAVKGEMLVGWATAQDTSDPTVEYTCSGCGTFVARGQSTHIPPTAPGYTAPQLHFATMRGLNSSTTYSYRVGDRKGDWSEVNHFTTGPDEDGPLHILSIGDHGTIEGAKKVLAAMLTAQQKLQFDFLIHAGDISYANGKPELWDVWSQLVQPLAAQVPWMVSQGNHEVNCLGYLYRFAMPAAANAGPESLNMYYSFNHGNVHVIALNSEAGDFSAQVEWVQKDLQQVNRTETPWVIGLWHRPWYCSSTVHADSGREMREALEDIFYRAKVDLVVNGHVHSYERALPVYRDNLTADAPVYITNGVGGNGLDASWGRTPVWSAQRLSTYGFGIIEVSNGTHLHWTLRDASDGAIIDDVWIVRPFPRRLP